MTRDLVLCSTSRYRRELLERLHLTFTTARPETDETPLPDEAADALCERLAVAKARALAGQFPTSLLIGSDQVASVGGRVVGKPGSRDASIEQLLASSGRDVEFHTAVAVFDAANDRCLVERDRTTVRFRELTRAEVERYVNQEPAMDCAGSFKCEGLGIVLFDAIDSRDPTALIGLPLIATARLLREFGIDPLA